MKKSRRAKLLDRNYNTRDAQLFIIATEGAKTEKPYFDMFQDPRIKVEVLPTGEKNDSAPQHVIERLNQFAEKYQLGKEDSLWLVLDVDCWGDKNLSTVCRQAKQKKYHLAISNPCFETWLWLHLDDLDPNDKTCKDFKKRLRSELGSYNSSNLDITPYAQKIPDAVQRAKELHPNANQNWPPTPGSHVYRVVEILLKVINHP
ncbi:MAG: RloB domain-containing protein [Symploca sp. SIO1B1]|nr:RloB domain-containing protein [Symploca sp. SIO1C2]NER97827.1 RloB domain-containing protein [Symploca sp. SIO1B1]